MPFFIAVLVALLLPAAATANLQADYRFEGDLNSDVGGAPKLKETAGDGSFGHDSVGDHTNGIFKYKKGTCLRLANAQKVIKSATSYTIAMTVQLSDVDGYNKLVDLDNQTTEYGLYVDDKTLYPYSTDYSGEIIRAERYYDLALAREPSGQLRGYVDGRRRVQTQDPDDELVLGADKILHFLCDDEVTGTEESGGRIARLRIFDNAISDSAIRNLEP